MGRFRVIGSFRDTLVCWRRVLKLCWSIGAQATCFLLLLMILTGLIPALQIQITKELVQEVQLAITNHAASALVSGAIFFALAQGGITLFVVLLKAAQQYFQQLLQYQLLQTISVAIMEKAVALDLQHFEDDQLYDQLQRARQESYSRPYQILTGLLSLLSQGISIGSIAVVLFSWNVWLGLLILLSPLPSLYAKTVFSNKTYAIQRARAKELRGLLYMQQLVTTAASVKEVRLFRLGPLFLTRFRERFETFFRVDRRVLNQQTAITAPLDLLSACLSAGVQIYAILFAIAQANMGLLAAYIQAITLMQGSITGLLSSLSQLYENQLFMRNLFDFLDLTLVQPQTGTRPFPKPLRQGIEFRNVSFRYPGTSRLVLQDVSFFCRAGECIALVGKNGAGKTTIIKLLTRLYEPTAGTILVDDIPIQEYDLETLRKRIGTIFQDFVQYEMNVVDNIGFGCLEERSNRERIETAARASGAAPVVEHLPQNYETILGRMFEKGEQLSIGQWQKIALARAFISQAPVIVLDEPTASIDAETEAEIFNTFSQMTQGATALLIAHRFSTIRMANHILVLEDGRIVEQGTHEHLLHNQGLYGHLFSLQAAGYANEKSSVPSE